MLRQLSRDLFSSERLMFAAHISLVLSSAFNFAFFCFRPGSRQRPREIIDCHTAKVEESGTERRCLTLRQYVCRCSIQAQKMSIEYMYSMFKLCLSSLQKYYLRNRSWISLRELKFMSELHWVFLCLYCTVHGIACFLKPLYLGEYFLYSLSILRE